MYTISLKTAATVTATEQQFDYEKRCAKGDSVRNKYEGNTENNDIWETKSRHICVFSEHGKTKTRKKLSFLTTVIHGRFSLASLQVTELQFVGAK